MDVKIALIGGGNVGQGFLSLIRDRFEDIKKLYDLNLQIMAICDNSAGTVISKEPLNIKEILPLMEDGIGLNEYSSQKGTIIKGLDAAATIELSNAHVIVECTTSDIITAQPAQNFIETALRSRKHVVTSNKGPIALNHKELENLAEENGVKLLFQASVMGGIPVLKLFSESFIADKVLEIKGILNVSTNYILYLMEEGATLENAIKEAQRQGYMDSNPDMDLNGYDAMAKLMILINLLPGEKLSAEKIKREGISNITQEEIQQAIQQNKRFKMISTAWREEDDSWAAQVGLFRLSNTDPLYNVPPTNNAISIKTENIGNIYLEGPGTGKIQCGMALLEDLLSIYIS